MHLAANAYALVTLTKFEANEAATGKSVYIEPSAEEEDSEDEDEDDDDDDVFGPDVETRRRRRRRRLRDLEEATLKKRRRLVDEWADATAGDEEDEEGAMRAFLAWALLLSFGFRLADPR